MKILSVEPTPSPNSMKLNLDEKLPDGLKYTYSQDNADKAPPLIRRLLSVEGVKSIFHAVDFMAIDRFPKYDWQPILSGIHKMFGQSEQQSDPADASLDSAYGEIKVMLQQFRGLPIQVRVSNGTEELRSALPDRFNDAIMRATQAQPFLIRERKLVELDVRYGELQHVLNEVVEEIDASYSNDRLHDLVEQILHTSPNDNSTDEPPHRTQLTKEEISVLLEDPDWKVRYGALDQIEPSLDTLPLLVKALQDQNTSVRRLASVYIGDIGEPETFPYLFTALKDPNASVRRTVGDTLSDLGDPAAIGPMSEALQDPNKLVRWRAARFLYEVGDESALEALRAAQDDPEFEVAMQIKIAIERIEGGHEALGSVWQQMTQARN